MKVLFLDVDGVLNNWAALDEQGIAALDSASLRLLRRIVKATGANIVLSSTWRLHRELFDTLKGRLQAFGILDSLIDQTPDLKKWPRHEEIEAWLKGRSDIERYAIIDDYEEARIPNNYESFFKTDETIGLTVPIANRVIAYLNQ